MLFCLDSYYLKAITTGMVELISNVYDHFKGRQFYIVFLISKQVGTYPSASIL